MKQIIQHRLLITSLLIIGSLTLWGCAHDIADHDSTDPGLNDNSQAADPALIKEPQRNEVVQDVVTEVTEKESRQADVIAEASDQATANGSVSKPKIGLPNKQRALEQAPSTFHSQAALQKHHGINDIRLRHKPIAPPHYTDYYYTDHYYGNPENRENYRDRQENPIQLVIENPVSTFSIDVDTASYSNARRFLRSGGTPPQEAIRVEEFINYFSYDYPTPKERQAPFSLYTEVAPSPWSPGKHLLHVGLRGYDVDKSQLPTSNLVFLLDVSGSMNQPNKLPLLKTALNLLTSQLSDKDRVSIVVYAGAAGVVLEPTAGNDHLAISSALNRLRAGGSTNGGAGIELAYAKAQQSYIDGGINRVILATDGDFNVGTANIDALKKLVEARRKTGISLTTLGFGMGNYNDALMNELTEIGNGNAAYIDTALEARKVLVDELSATLMTIAKDVKIQIEFSPQVQEYRLVGYESRLLKREDFNNDKIDAGEIGAGHRVTALYEITLAGSDAASIDPLRYQAPGQSSNRSSDQSSNAAKRPQQLGNELAFLKLRYKLPKEEQSRLIEQPIYLNQIKATLADASDNFRFSAAVAAFAQRLRSSAYGGDFSYQNIQQLASGAKAEDQFGYRNELLGLIKMADTLEMAALPGQAPVPEKQKPQELTRKH